MPSAAKGEPGRDNVTHRIHRITQIISVHSVYSVGDNPQPGSKSLTQIKQIEQIKKSFQICDNHEVLATNQWCKPNAENELARAMVRRRLLMPNGNGSPKASATRAATTKCSRPNGSPQGQRNARSNLCANIYQLPAD